MWIAIVVLFVAAILSGFFFIFYRYKRRQFEEQLRLQRMHHQFSESLRLSVLESQENERARLANDLHDALVGHLTALQLGIDMEKPKEFLMGETDFCIQEARRISHDLYPPFMEEQPADQVLQTLLDQWACRFRIRFRKSIRTSCLVPPEIKRHLLRIVQELLVNSRKHGNATAIDLYLRISEKSLAMCYTDDGEGMTSDQPFGHGLRSIQNRILLLNGLYRIKTANGFSLLMLVPEKRQ